MKVYIEKARSDVEYLNVGKKPLNREDFREFSATRDVPVDFDPREVSKVSPESVIRKPVKSSFDRDWAYGGRKMGLPIGPGKGYPTDVSVGGVSPTVQERAVSSLVSPTVQDRAVPSRDVGRSSNVARTLEERGVSPTEVNLRAPGVQTEGRVGGGTTDSGPRTVSMRGSEPKAKEGVSARPTLWDRISGIFGRKKQGGGTSGASSLRGVSPAEPKVSSGNIGGTQGFDAVPGVNPGEQWESQMHQFSENEGIAHPEMLAARAAKMQAVDQAARTYGIKSDEAKQVSQKPLFDFHQENVAQSRGPVETAGQSGPQRVWEKPSGLIESDPVLERNLEMFGAKEPRAESSGAGLAGTSPETPGAKAQAEKNRVHTLEGTGSPGAVSRDVASGSGQGGGGTSPETPGAKAAAEGQVTPAIGPRSVSMSGRSSDTESLRSLAQESFGVSPQTSFGSSQPTQQYSSAGSSVSGTSQMQGISPSGSSSSVGGSATGQSSPMNVTQPFGLRAAQSATSQSSSPVVTAEHKAPQVPSSKVSEMLGQKLTPPTAGATGPQPSSSQSGGFSSPTATAEHTAPKLSESKVSEMTGGSSESSQSSTSKSIGEDMEKGLIVSMGRGQGGGHHDMHCYMGTPYEAKAKELKARECRVKADMEEMEPPSLDDLFSKDKDRKKDTKRDKLCRDLRKIEADWMRLHADCLEWCAKELRKNDSTQKSIQFSSPQEVSDELSFFTGTSYYAKAAENLARQSELMGKIKEIPYDGDNSTIKKRDRLQKKLDEEEKKFMKLQADALREKAKDAKKDNCREDMVIPFVNGGKTQKGIFGDDLRSDLLFFIGSPVYAQAAENLAKQREVRADLSGLSWDKPSDKLKRTRLNRKLDKLSKDFYSLQAKALKERAKESRRMGKGIPKGGEDFGKPVPEGKEVKHYVKKFKEGTSLSSTGKPIKSRKQAIAIGMSEDRDGGGKKKKASKSYQAAVSYLSEAEGSLGSLLS